MSPFSDPHSSPLLHSTTSSYPSATATFFSIPELVQYLGYFLTAQDIALFRATNKTYYQALHTLFWQTVNLLDDGNSIDQPDSKTIRLLDSRLATRAFALNQQYIQSLSCQSSFIAHHFYGLWVLLDVVEHLKPGVALMDVSSRETLQDMMATAQEMLAKTPLHDGTTVSKRPRWLLSSSVSSPFGCASAVPVVYTANAGLLFPPLTNLTRLECALKVEWFTNWRSLPSRYPISKSMVNMFLYWVLYFNKALTHVKIDRIDLTTLKPVRVLAETLSGLAHLRSLELSTEMTEQDQTKNPVGEYLLFHCSHTLEVFHLKAEVGAASKALPVVVTPWYDHTVTEEYFLKYTPDWMKSSYTPEEGGVEIPRRLMPHLRSLRMPDMPETGYTDEFCPVLENCPALEALVLPTVGLRPFSLNKMLCIIKDQRLPLKRITVAYPRKHDKLHETPGSVIDILHEHTLEALNISFFKEGPYTSLTSKLFRHSETLCDLTFDAVESLYSTTILDFLCSCHALKKLVVRSGGDINDNKLDDIQCLQDISLAITHAIAKPWVCLRLSHLEIPVMLDWFAYTPPSPANPSWFHDWRNTQGDSNWEALRKFYHQIGRLHQLEILDLKACLVYPNSVASGATWSDITLPGMLLMPFTPKPSLLPPPRNQNITPGFLDVLSGLTKLRELRGSVRVDLPEMRLAMRLDSYRWMARHWPKLKIAEFLQPGYQCAFVYTLPEHITWLFAERPSLKLAADKKPDKAAPK